MSRTAVRLIVALLLTAVAVAAPAASIAAQSDAHRPDAMGAYGGLKSRNPSLREAPAARAERDRLKQPYPYRYATDTNRGPGACYWLARRAIDTKNRNWWTRYRACKD